MGTEVTLEQLAGYCRELGLMHRVEADRGMVSTALGVEHGLYWLTLRPDIPREVLLVRLPRLLMVPAERRLPMAQAVAHLNFCVLLGRFAMDLTDGEVMLDVAIPYRGGGVSLGQVAQSLTAVAWTLNKFVPALQRLCWGDVSVEEALELPLPAPAEALARALQQVEASASTQEEGSDPPGAGC